MLKGAPSFGTRQAGGLRSIWQRYADSYDASVLDNYVHPKAVLPVVIGASAIILAMYFVPKAQAYTSLDHPSISIGILIAGCVTSLLQWRNWKRSTFVNVLQLLDTTLYCLAVIAVMVDTASPIKYVWALIYAQMAVSYGQRYGFNWPMLASVVVVPFGVILWFCIADWGILALTLFGALMFIVVSMATEKAREINRQKEKFKSAYTLADKVATESLDIALATTMAEVGTFLHEIKNSLTPITANIMLLKEDEDLSEDSKEVIEDLETSGKRCNDLIERLFSSITRRASTPSTRFLLQDALQQESLCRGLPPGDRRKIALVGTVPPFEISGDSEHLLAAITNLLSNALQAGARHVEISASYDGGLRSAIISVKDDGPGMPESLRENLFVPLKGSSKGPGHGLGLPLSRRLVDVLGGQLVLKDSGANGTTFEIILPGRYVPISEAPSPNASPETEAHAERQ